MMAMERRFYIGVIAVLSLFLIFSRLFCHQPAKNPCSEIVKQTVIQIKRDTVEVVKKDSSGWHQPKLYQRQLQPQHSPLMPLHDSDISDVLKEPEESKRDSIAKADYYTLNSYSDTNHVDGGVVVVENKVYMNRLAFQRVVTDIKSQVITEQKIVTNTVQLPTKGQMYVGPIAQGQKNDLLTAFGIQGLYKTKRDKIWTVSVLYGKGGSMIYQAGHMFKLSF